MDMEARKYKAIEKLLKVEEEDIIYRLEAILDDVSANGWDELPEEVKKMIDAGLSQSAAGQVVSNEEIMNNYKQRYNIS